MGLNIKNPRVHQLAKEAAEITGKNQTSAIEEALEQLIERHRKSDAEARRRTRVAEILDDMRRIVRERDGGAALSSDFLYDDATGLPR